ncbi:class I SAM-dependent methyltransferase [Nocardioides houyundeii]|uniref:class I SAM-dependent methyltransferase n=1 Tax=Nocardioides houyundeii TaxID=2045452 RepID=UPI000DF48836|nr:class I SAM-dependent methyltransferase [Nocardioides houyundeii]
MSATLPRRTVRLLTAVTALGVAANTRRLRGRAQHLARLDAEPAPSAPASAPGWVAVTATGVTLDARTLDQAAAWAVREGLEAVDLVPADLPVERALDLLRQVDTVAFRADPLTEGRTAGHALVVRADLAARAELPTGPVSPAELIEVARQAKRFAPRGCDFAVAPYERAVSQRPGEQLAVQRTVFDRYGTVNLTAIGGELAILGLGVLRTPALGLPALALHHAAPAAVLAGNPAGLAPRDLAVRTALRLPGEALRLLRLLRAEAPQPESIRAADALREGYAKELAEGTERFFEPRVQACRWCGSPDLSCRVATPDLIQHKPGTFRLDECASCGHVFQNPRLSIEGLDFYYRDFYDGFAGEEMEKVFASEAGEYDGRATMVAAHDPAPARWLDVGSGHAHFCLVARDYFPETSFEGIDLSAGIEDAARRGWVDRAYRGMFPDVAPELADQFDVVSMLHYLEHTREPREELDAAATALVPGGLLMVEVPDPECPSSRTLGRYWMPWLQPQHQHFLSMARLEEALVERGFTVLERYRAPSMRAPDTLAAAWLAAGQVVPRPWMPWLPRPTPARRAARVAALAAAVPAAVAAAAAGQVASARAGEEPGNAFRVLARYDG